MAQRCIVHRHMDADDEPARRDLVFCPRHRLAPVGAKSSVQYMPDWWTNHNLRVADAIMQPIDLLSRMFPWHAAHERPSHTIFVFYEWWNHNGFCMVPVLGILLLLFLLGGKMTGRKARLDDYCTLLAPGPRLHLVMKNALIICSSYNLISLPNPSSLINQRVLDLSRC